MPNPTRAAHLAGSFIVTVGILSGCGPKPGPTVNPPVPTTEVPPAPQPTTSTTTTPKDPAPKGESVVRMDGKCFVEVFVATNCPPNVPCNPPGPLYQEVACPANALPNAPAGVTVHTRKDGTCFYTESHDMPCDPGDLCNPPPPEDIDVNCR